MNRRDDFNKLRYVETTRDTVQTERFLDSGTNTLNKAELLKNEIRNLKK